MIFLDKLEIRGERVSEPVRGIQSKTSGILMKQGVFSVHLLEYGFGQKSSQCKGG